MFRWIKDWDQSYQDEFVQSLEYYISILESAATTLIVCHITPPFSMIRFHLGPAHLIIDGIGLPH